MRCLEHSAFSWNTTLEQHYFLAMAKLGPLPYHDKEKQLDWDEQNRGGIYLLTPCKPLKEFMSCQDSDHKNLSDLVQKMLDYVPDKHCSYHAALSFSPLKGRKRGQGPAAKKVE